MPKPLSTELSRAHDDFVSTVSHEFRTPLTSIKGFADTLIRYDAQLSDEEKRRFVNIIKDQAERLIRLVENLLIVSKMGREALDLTYRPIRLDRMVDKVIQGMQGGGQRASRFDVRITPASLAVWADTDRLEQILINLMDNAVKYSPEHSTVTISAGFVPEDEHRIRISVEDAGIGIPADLLPSIFTKFYRVEGPLTQGVDGTGLGLYIAQSLTQAMGGHIEAASELGKGSTFTLTLPASTPERQAIHQRRLAAGHE